MLGDVVVSVKTITETLWFERETHKCLEVKLKV